MGLLSFLKRQPATAREPADPAEAVQRARTNARRRLIGAVVLLGVGVIGFPLLFETQPRPIPVDIAIDIPRKEGAVPPDVPAARTAPRAPAAAEKPEDTGRDIAPPQAAAAASKPSAVPAVPASPTRDRAAAETERTPAPVVSPPSPPPAPPANTDAQRARALLEGRPSAENTRAADEAASRFVVQVGAFADASSAREARAKVEKLGLKTYTQVVDTSAGKRTRVRVGPFANREEADKASSRIKSAGLAAAVLTL
ncbi:SPOR domain-containing protein [Aquincola sp. MAHUQ-54]|uniref:SPOR domain-containing protein n=1 Tax=Aquincola agrisoli TaxID=3119538 RepID=A0AAW9Q7S0_9BURK